MNQVQLTDRQINACGLWRDPQGTVRLPVPHILPYFKTLTAGQVLAGDEIGTPGAVDFEIRVVSATITFAATLIRIQWPDGRYMSPRGVDFFSFVGTGRRGRLLQPFKTVHPNQKIRLDLDNTLGGAGTIEIYFEGVLWVPFQA